MSSSPESKTDRTERLTEPVAYGDIFDFPPTLKEIRRFCALSISEDALQQELENGSDLAKAVSSSDGFYYIKGRDELVEAAAAQLRELPYYNSFFQCAHPPSIELSRVLGEVTQPHFSRVFYTGSGSESIYTMIRMVWRYWDLKGQPERKIIVARKNAYHGSTVAGASLGGMTPMHNQGGSLGNITHIEQPYWFGSDHSMSPDDFGLFAARELEKKIEEVGADKIAAFVGEPIQGAGGVIIPPDTYWPEIQRICNEHGILLITDEVICGFGRLGEWFGADHYGVKPDLMTFAKGVTSGYLPLGGVMVGDRVTDVLIDKGHGHVVQFVQGRGYLEAQFVQPVLAYP